MRTIDYRYGAAPISLPRNQPVPYPVGYRLFTPTVFLQAVADILEAVRALLSVKGTRIYHSPGFDPGFFQFIAVPSVRGYYYPDGRSILFRKSEVPGIMGRNCHDGSGT